MESLLIVLFTFLSFLMGVAQFVFGGIIDKVSESIGVSLAAIGQLTTIYSLSAAIGTPIVMIALSKKPLHQILYFGLINMIIGNALVFMAPNFGLLMLARVLVGLGAGVYGIAAFSIIAQKAKPERRGRDLSMISVGASLALVIGVPFSRTLTALLDWRYIFLGLSLVMVIILILLTSMLKTSGTQEPIPLRQQLSYLVSRQTALLFLVTLLMFLGYSALNTYLTPYLLNLADSFGSNISWILMALGLASLLGSRIGGVLSDRYGVGAVIELALIIQALALLLLSFLNHSVWLSLILLFIWATMAWTCGPIFNLNINTRFTKGTGIILSINGTMIQFGFALGAVVGGVVLEQVGVASMSGLASAFVVLSAVLFWLERKMHRN